MAYPSVYPGSLDSYSVRTDNIDNVMAVDVNELQSAIVAIETKAGLTGFLHAEVVDAFALRIAGTTGRLKIFGYFDATNGSLIQAMNTAESGYVPLSLDGSVVLIRLSGLHVGGTSDPGDNNLLVDGASVLTGRTDVGAANFGAKLNIKSASGSSQLAYLANNDFASGTVGSMLQLSFAATTGNTNAQIAALTTGGTAWGNLVMQYGGGRVGIGTTAPTAALHVVGLVDYANNAAAVAAGLTAGAFYTETGTNPKRVCVTY